MKIISAKYKDGRVIDQKQMQKDMLLIKKEHEKALDAEPTWAIFGGVIRINDRLYHVY